MENVPYMLVAEQLNRQHPPPSLCHRAVGDAEGVLVGARLGDAGVGEVVGDAVVGTDVGEAVGATVVGANVGAAVGVNVGVAVGVRVGAAVGHGS